VQSYTRHQLKEDKFQEVTRGALGQAQAHRQQLAVGAIVILLVVVLGGGYFLWRSAQNDKASTAMGDAMNVYSAPLRAPNAAVEPGQLTFDSVQQRAKEAEKKFQAVAQQYPHTDAGKNAAYMAAVTALESSDYPAAESRFKALADSGNKDLSSLANMGLASVYESTNRDSDAVKIYTELSNKPTESVSRERAQFALASLYESKDPAQAKKIYDQLASDKSPAVAQVAKQRQAALGK
jgi:predicted negative regulator of RcsB-dependent stress response